VTDINSASSILGGRPISAVKAQRPTPEAYFVSIQPKCNECEQTFIFKLDAGPEGIAIDPDEWTLKVLYLPEER
jgi:hypothetical protein